MLLLFELQGVPIRLRVYLYAYTKRLCFHFSVEENVGFFCGVSGRFMHDRLPDVDTVITLFYVFIYFNSVDTIYYRNCAAGRSSLAHDLF